MTNEQLQNFLKQYPNECNIIIESSFCNECDITRIRAEYEYNNNFKIPILILEYQKKLRAIKGDYV